MNDGYVMRTTLIYVGIMITIAVVCGVLLITP